MASSTKKKSTTKSTRCQTCGKEISYSTKKPLYCKEHRPPKQYQHTTKSSRNTHLYERSIFKVIESVIIAGACRNGYYTWLPSPKGEPMQLDWYCNCGIEIAFEIQGEQHYSFNKFFHKTQADFDYQVLCDNLKEDLCRKRGVYLFKIRYGTKVDAAYIIALLKANGCMPELIRHGAIKKNLLE
jgi:hypothetical protein